MEARRITASESVSPAGDIACVVRDPDINYRRRDANGI